MRRGIGRQRAGGGVFNPLSLFSAGEQGAIYDPTDTATTFQDTAGTTPATVAGQSVKRLNDKSGRGNHWIEATNPPTLQVDANGVYYLAFDGTNDILSAAITGWGSNMQVCAAIQPSSTAQHILLYETSTLNKFVGLSKSADTASSYAGAGNPALCVDGVQIATTRDVLNTALGSGTTRIEDYVGIDPSAWTDFRFGAYNTLCFPGRFYGLVATTHVAMGDVANVRQYLANKARKTLSGNQTGLFSFALGDSTVATYTTYVSVISIVNTTTVKTSIAVAGETIAQQQARWAVAVNRQLARWVVIQVGLNDLDPLEAASVAIARLQSLTNDVVAAVGSTSKVLISQMTPCKARLNAMYGANGPVSYQKWLDMNAAIAGTGPTPITGAHGRVTSHVALLGDGSDNLAAAYDIGDGIHENDAGRQIVATAWEGVLNTLGAL